MSATNIAWTDATWNPVTGCSKASPGCAHCYAEALSHRFGRSFDVTLHPDRLDLPLRWRKPRRVFVNSMSDLFHPDVPDQFIGRVWTTMMWAERHTFQVLTKRPRRMRDWVIEQVWRTTPNVWLGTSIESDRYVGRADALRETPAAVRFISAEPLLGPLPSLDLTGIDWLIVGGESGPGARPMDPAWVRKLVHRADRAGTVAVFVKQDSGRLPGKQGRLPDDLWARKEYPR